MPSAFSCFGGVSPRSAAIASSRTRRCPTAVTPMSLRSSAVSFGRIAPDRSRNSAPHPAAAAVHSSRSLRSRPLIVLRSRRVAALVLDPAVDRAEHLLELDQHHALGELASAAASVAGKAHFAQFPRRELRYLRLASIRGEI